MPELSTSGARRAPAREWGWRTYAALAAIYVVARAALVLVLADVFGYGEELAKGAAGKAMLDGLPLEHHRLAFHYYEGGGFVASHLDAVGFALLGPRLIVHKLIAIAFGVAILCLGARFCDRWFGRASAIAFAALFTLAPASFQKLSLLNLGIHFEALVFTLAILHLSITLCREAHPRRRTWFLLGLASGFGSYYSFQCVLTSAVGALAIAVFGGRRALARPAWAGVAGLAVGLAPLAWMMSRVGLAVFDIHGEALVGDPAPAEPRLELARHFLRDLFAQRTPLDLAAMVGLPLLALAGAVGGWTSGGSARRASLIVLGFLGVYLGAYVVSRFLVGDVYHYFRLNRLAPAWLAASVLAAVGATWLVARPLRPLRVAGWALALAVLAGGARDLALVARGGRGFELADNLAVLWRTRGYEYPDYVDKLAQHVPGDLGARLRVLAAFDEPRRELLNPAIGTTLFRSSDLSFEEIAALARSHVRDDWPSVLAGLGPLLRRRHADGLEQRLSAIERMPEPMRDPLREALGRFGTGLVISEQRVQGELASVRSLELPDAYWRGVGWRLRKASFSAREAGLPYHAAVPAAPWCSPERAAELVAGEEPTRRALILAGYEEARRAHELGR